MNKKMKTRVDPVEVYCRVRPMAADCECESCLKILDETNLMLQIPESSASYRSGQIKQLIYSFTNVFDESTPQKKIFEQVGLPLVQDLLEGRNGLLFTYGVTGSGKTYTMNGTPQDLGLLQRCLDTVFNSISFKQSKKYIFKPDKMNSFDIQSEAEASLERQKRDMFNNPNMPNVQQQFQNQIKQTNNNNNGLSTFLPSTSSKSKAHSDIEKLNEPNGKLVNINEDHIYSVFISSIEIYNYYIYDLLDEFTDPTKRFDKDSRESKSLKEDTKGNMYIKDVAEIEVKSTEEALELMHRAQKRRFVAPTDLNAESSRSHSIFTIKVVQAPYDPSNEELSPRSKSSILVSQLSLVDLAGSERTKRTKNTGNRLKEAGSINSSLMALRNCMETLRENTASGRNRMVPYRDSKLTLLFKNYFEGHGRIKMILCINPSAIEFDETINVLKFSDLVQDVLVPATPVINRNQRFNNQQSAKVSLDGLEQANLNLLNNLQQNNYSMMPEAFPSLDIFSPDDTVTLIKLIEYLEEFQRKRDSLIHETDSIKQHFYGKIRELNEELERVKEERNELKHRLEMKEKEQLKSDSKIKALEKVINQNSYRFTPLQTTTTTMSASTSSSNKENIRQINGTPISSNYVFNSSGEKIITTTTPATETPVISSYRSSRVNTATPSINRNIGFNSHHNTNSTGVPPLPSITPSSNRFTNLTNNYLNNQRLQSPMRYQNNHNSQHTPAVSNLVKEGVPVANKRTQRRSKSAEMWLDHKPPTTTKTETVMQPKMQRKKSVSKIELTDAKKSTKYVLTHQQQDDEGEIVTNLIKGDIIQSPSGGANVIFNEMEILHCKPQEIPKPRKRPSEEFTIDDRGLIEDRCSIAIEGHSTRTRSIKKTKS